MKKYIPFILFLLSYGVCLTSCDDEETYAEQKEKEYNLIQKFLKRDVVIYDSEGDTLCHVGRVNVISEDQFYAQDSTTNVEKNEYVLFKRSGVYMQIVRKGSGQSIQPGESKRIMCRFLEYNILGDSVQLRNDMNYWHTHPDIIDVTNTFGTISGTFNTTVNGGGAMYTTYSNVTVPNGWLLPLSYIRIGRQISADEGIAKVRLVLPHSEGQTDATTNVYPCFYEILYQEMRD